MGGRGRLRATNLLNAAGLLMHNDPRQFIQPSQVYGCQHAMDSSCCGDKLDENIRKSVEGADWCATWAPGTKKQSSVRRNYCISDKVGALVGQMEVTADQYAICALAAL